MKGRSVKHQIKQHLDNEILADSSGFTLYERAVTTTKNLVLLSSCAPGLVKVVHACRMINKHITSYCNIHNPHFFYSQAKW